MFPAHAGMTRQRFPDELVNELVFPAHAGMTRPRVWFRPCHLCVPRPRGDDPVSW